MSTCPAHANNSLGNIQKWNIIVVVVYISSVVYIIRLCRSYNIWWRTQADRQWVINNHL